MIAIKWIIFLIVVAILIIGAIDEYVIQLNIGILYANAETVNNAIGIDFSKTYTTHLKINPDLHPTYDDLLSLNLDNSDRRITGDFITKDGITQRDNPSMINHWRYYKYSTNYLIFIDPPSDMRDKLKMITIESNLDVYLDKSQMTKQDNVRHYNIDRWINKSCTKAIIGADDYLRLLSDTVYLMRNNCDYSKSVFKHQMNVTDDATYQDISTSQKYKEEQWKNEIKSTHTESKIGKDNSTNKSVTEDKVPKYVPPKTPPFNYTSVR